MGPRAIGLAVAGVVAAGTAVGIISSSDDGDKQEPESGDVATPFPDSHEPPPGWTGPVFRLSQSYPTSMPGLSPAPWQKLSFRTQSAAYLKAVLAYALEGNREVEFRGQDNTVRKWFHAPWMHVGASGREFIHGLTRERTSPPRELAPTQTQPARSWAVSMYNPRGGYVLGQVWKNPDAPDATKAKFPEGSVAFKLLFTTAPVSQVPYLANSLEWRADINRSSNTGPRPTVRLLQIDVAVRDRRANSTTGWVFGTFIYNANASGATVWDRMVPVGLMWGNDPERLTNPNRKLRQTVITNPEDHPAPQHLGFQGRLNGPLDNPRSSCLSCHSTAQIPADLSRPSVPGLVPANASAGVLAQYFRNIAATDPFIEGQLSLDYSLQLQNGIAQRAAAGGLEAAPGPTGDAGEDRELDASEGVKVKPVQR